MEKELHYAFRRAAEIDLGKDKDEDGPNLDVIERFGDEDTLRGGAIRIQLASSAIKLAGELRTAARQNARRWPLMLKHGIATLAYEDGQAEPKGTAFDVGTFLAIFDNAESFSRSMMTTARELAKSWNDMYAGRRELGNRKPVDHWVTVRSHRFARGGGGRQTYSAVGFNINSWQAVADGLNRSAGAVMVPEEHMRVQLRVRTCIGFNSDDKLDIGFYGFTCSLPAFDKLLHSQEIKRAVEAAKEFMLEMPPLLPKDKVDPRDPVGGAESFKGPRGKKQQQQQQQGGKRAVGAGGPAAKRKRASAAKKEPTVEEPPEDREDESDESTAAVASTQEIDWDALNAEAEGSGQD